MENNKRKILIADNDPRFLEFVEYKLKTAGYEVIIADSGTKAVESAVGQMPDLFILDIMMPGMDGTDVVSVLRENPRFKDTPVIFITGLCQGEERSEGGSPSNVCVLAKPLDSDELIEKVNSLLQAT